MTTGHAEERTIPRGSLTSVPIEWPELGVGVAVCRCLLIPGLAAIAGLSPVGGSLLIALLSARGRRCRDFPVAFFEYPDAFFQSRDLTGIGTGTRLWRVVCGSATIARCSITAVTGCSVTTVAGCSITTVAGLAPAAYELGGANPFMTPMIMAMLWGVLFGTFVSLILLPCLFASEQDFRGIVRKIFRG